MTERPVTETGIFSRSGFSNPSKSADLIKTLKSEINHELLKLEKAFQQQG